MQAEEPFEALPRADGNAAAVGASRVPLLVAVYSIGLVLFLAVEPTKPWILLVVTALVALGTDGILREHPQAARQQDAAWTAPLLFLPTLLALGGGLFLEDAVHGYWIVPSAAIVALLMAAVLYAEDLSIDETGVMYPLARFILNLGTYLTAFAFYAVVYTFGVSLLPAAFAVGLVSLLLAVEILREAEADPLRALIFAGAVGLMIAEVRWALYFLPLESYLAGVLLLLCFYLASGLVQHHLNRDLRGAVVGEFGAIALLGVLIVALGRICESGGC